MSWQTFPNSELLLLGTGGSSGSPMIGCTCAACLSSDPYNKRLRTCALLTCGLKKILIDCGPDIRCQALKYHIEQLDGLLITHAHFDHIAGLDEMRAFYIKNKKPLPVLLSEPTYRDIKTRHPYFFQKPDSSVSLPAQFEFHVLEKERGRVEFLGMPIDYMRFMQAGVEVLGFRFGPLAYISDIKSYPESIFQDLAGVKLLVLSMLGKTASKMHFGLEESVAFAHNVGAQMTYLTHIGHRSDHAEVNALLPPGMQLGFDGLKLEFEYGVGE